MARINHQPLMVRLNHEHFKEFFPNTPVTPTAKPAMGIFPVPKVRRQIAPWRSRSQYPEHRVNKQPVVSGRATNAPLFCRGDVPVCFPKHCQKYHVVDVRT